jgi:hypothetical protein
MPAQTAVSGPALEALYWRLRDARQHPSDAVLAVLRQDISNLNSFFPFPLSFPSSNAAERQALEKGKFHALIDKLYTFYN